MTHRESPDDEVEAWAAIAAERGELVHFAEIGIKHTDGSMTPWAVCDKAAGLRPDIGKFVATGLGRDLVTCPECIGLM